MPAHWQDPAAGDAELGRPTLAETAQLIERFTTHTREDMTFAMPPMLKSRPPLSNTSQSSTTGSG
ncbi:MAG: hypothetical protein JNL84_07585 [Candidatus Accumulibacter sp.]|nr:hypothetical protein [Accumulibacter sp.]